MGVRQAPERPDEALRGLAPAATPRDRGILAFSGALGAQSPQQAGQGDAHRADLAAGATESRGLRQFPLPVQALELGFEDAADGSGVDGAIGMTAEAGVDRTMIHAGAAADAAQRGPQRPIPMDAGAAIVEQDKVHLPGTVAFSRPAGPTDQVDVGGDGLAGGGPGQQGQEGRQLVQAGDDLLDTAHGDMEVRRRGAEAAVAFVLHQAQGTGLSDGEVDARQSGDGLAEVLAHDAPGDGRQALDVLGVGILREMGGEEGRDLPPVLVDGRGDDVGRAFPRQLQDEFPQIRLHCLDALGLQIVVQAHLLRDHGLALDDPPGALAAQQVEDDRVALRHGLRPVDPDAVALAVGLQFQQQIRQVGQGLTTNQLAAPTQDGQLMGVGKGLTALGDQPIHGPAEIPTQPIVIEGLTDADGELRGHGCAPTTIQRCA